MHLCFLDEGTQWDLGALLEHGSVVGGWLAQREADACAMVLSNSSPSVACLFGAICAGRTVVSIPLPPRGASLDWYQDFVESVCRYAGASHLLLEGELLSAVPPLDGVHVASYEQVLSERVFSAASGSGFSLVQFTSGSTASPKGVKLSDNAIVANIDAILGVLEPRPGDNGCSWLPLSHDMGLIGMLLSSCLAATREGGRGGTLYLMRPEHFLRSPQDWLTACDRFRVTITAAPDFALSLATSRVPSTPLDLSQLRACITGGEPARATTLRSFASRFSPAGLEPQAICTAYGLAEAALAVTMDPLDSVWQSIQVDPNAIAEGELIPDDGDVEIVSAGVALPEYEVVAGCGEVSTLRFRGPSICDAYVGPHELPVDDEGWFTTNDLAFIENDHLYPVGRTDDMLVIAGRNVYAFDVEASLAGVSGIRAGRAVTLVDSQCRFVVAAELDPAFESTQASVQRLSAQVRATVVGRVGIAPDDVVFVERGQLPMTSSGKIRRRALAQALQSGELPSVIVGKTRARRSQSEAT